MAYLVRGADENSLSSFERFAASYLRHPAGTSHSVYFIFKGFADRGHRHEAELLLSSMRHKVIEVEDDRFDVGAYSDAAGQMMEKSVVFLNTGSEVLCDNWLAKLASNFGGQVGLVGATGSFERFGDEREGFPSFPNIHIRTNAFMVDRQVFRSVASGLPFREKRDTYLFESGVNSLTRQVVSRGLGVLVVGRNGRGYSPRWWPSSGTFRQGSQANLLIADNQTRRFARCCWADKRHLAMRSWGGYLNRFRSLPS